MAAQPQTLPALTPAPPPAPHPARGIAAAVVFLVLLISGGVYLWRVTHPRPAASQQQASARPVRRVPVRRANLEFRRRFTGSLHARNFANIVTPRLTIPENGRGMSLITLAPAGSHVRKGDILVEFDSQAAKDHLDDTRDGLHREEAILKRRIAELDIQLSAMQLRLDTARAKVDKARWDLRAIPVRSTIEAENLRINHEEAQAEFSAAVAELPLLFQSQAAWQNVYDLEVEVERLHVARHETDIRRLSVRSPIDGMVVIGSLYRAGEQATIATGDMLYPGMPVMRIVDTNSMEIQAYINQAESEQVRIGQPAVIRLDAYPDALYRGRVESIGMLANTPGRAQNYIRSIPIRVSIADPDPRLLPDLTASADVLLDTAPQALIAPSDAIHDDNGRPFVLVQKGETVERRSVTVGRMTGAHAIVEGGLAEGDLLIID